MKPVTLPIDGHPAELEERRFTADCRRFGLRLKYALEVARHHLDELRHQLVPISEYAGAELAAGVVDVLADEREHGLEIFDAFERFELDELLIAALRERAGGVEHIRDPAAH